ncbi:CDP-alcohol phosphatidyltransferase family protein [candidate division KSB1 bacterium]
MTIANFFSVLRVLLLPLLLYYIAADKDPVLIMSVFLIMVLTDYLDGFLARAMNQITQVGKILDPVADKICTLSVGIALVIYRDFPWWAMVVIIGRDSAILAFGYRIIRQRKKIPVSNIIGKITVTLVVAAFFAYLFKYNFIKLYLLYLMVFFLLVSAVNYYWISFRVLKSNNEG